MTCLATSGDVRPVQAQQATTSSAMTFFLTSVGRGYGGNLGGLAGADNHCQRLAESVGRANRTWRAYLSAPEAASRPVVHARDRIGKGPWVNAAGVRAMLGHHNKSGGGQRGDSWNSAHLSRGCSQNALKASMGDGLFYCFAID